MTNTQFLIILATIWISPTVHKGYGLFVGTILIILASLMGLFGEQGV